MEGGRHRAEQPRPMYVASAGSLPFLGICILLGAGPQSRDLLPVISAAPIAPVFQISSPTSVAAPAPAVPVSSIEVCATEACGTDEAGLAHGVVDGAVPVEDDGVHVGDDEVRALVASADLCSLPAVGV